MEKHSCTIIGCPTMCFAWGYDEEDEVCCALKLLILNRISYLHTLGITQFIVSMDDGIGLYAAETVKALQGKNENPELFCYIPYEEQSTKWTPELRDRYYSVLSACTSSILLSSRWTPTCEIDAMLEAIDQSEVVIAVSSGEEIQDKTFATALRYAEKIGREITLLTPPKIY